MLGSITIKGFKSVVDQTIELGRLNVFVGANGAGKSVVLEAIGVLGAAAYGRVDDASLLRRGVRPGVPALYKNAFATDEIPRFITLKSKASGPSPAVYEVALDNPIKKAAGTAWRFSHEKVAAAKASGERPFVSRAPRGATFYGPKGTSQSFKPADSTRGIADVPNPLGDPPPDVLAFLDGLRSYAIFDPQTPVLRGIEQEVAPNEPLGLHGGRLAEAMSPLLARIAKEPDLKKALFGLLGWVKAFGTAVPTPDLISPAIPAALKIVRFTDRYMRKERSSLSAYDASEGALYVLFALALLFHPKTPAMFAIDNIDHALHPKLARGLVEVMSAQVARADKQLLLTTHNPLVLDGLNLRDDAIRLFTVDRNAAGHTEVHRLEFTDALQKAQASGLTLSQLWVEGLIGGMPRIF
jgi:hypothetical protein